MKSFLSFIITGMLLSFQAWSQAGLVAHYSMNGTAHDVSGHNHHGTLHGSPFVTSDEYGFPNGALAFNGFNDYMEIPAALFQLPAYTWSACVKPLSTPSLGQVQSIISIGDNTADQYLLWCNLPSQNSVGFSDGSYYAPNVIPPDRSSQGFLPPANQWYHVAMTRSQTQLSLYVNGNLVSTVPVSATLPSYGSGNAVARIACRAGNVQFFDGVIEDIKIYDRALQSCHIGRLCNNNDPKNNGSLLAARTINNVEVEPALFCFPSPAKNNINIYSDGNINIKDIKVLDISGRTVLEELNTNSTDLNLNITVLKQGIFLIRATLVDGNILQSKFLKAD